jgi:hypothetical protein
LPPQLVIGVTECRDSGERPSATTRPAHRRLPPGIWRGAAYDGGMTTHVVMFRLADPADVAEAVHRLSHMADRIPGMTRLRVGANHNPGAHAYHLTLISEHTDRQALQDYSTHPAHREVLAWLGERIAERAVVDTDDF